MAKSQALSSEEARRKAEDRFRKAKQRETEAQTAQEELARRRLTETAKTEHLRALRLAKEAADADAARQAADAKTRAADEARQRKALRTAPAKAKADPA